MTPRELSRALFDLRCRSDELRLRVPKTWPERIQGAIEAHLVTAYDSLAAAYSHALDAEIEEVARDLKAAGNRPLTDDEQFREAAGRA